MVNTVLSIRTLYLRKQISSLKSIKIILIKIRLLIIKKKTKTENNINFVIIRAINIDKKTWFIY